jgi:hypothetical protein
VVPVAKECEVAHLHQIRLKTQTSVHENARSFTAALLDSYSKHAPTPSAYFKRQALTVYGCDVVNSLEFLACELNDASKEQLLKAGVRSLTAAGDSENEVDYTIFKVPDDNCGGLSLDIIAMVCPR